MEDLTLAYTTKQFYVRFFKEILLFNKLILKIALYLISRFKTGQLPFCGTGRFLSNMDHSCSMNAVIFPTRPTRIKNIFDAEWRKFK